MRILKILAASTALFASLWVYGSPIQIGPTVREVIEFKEILQPSRPGVDEFRPQLSPNGTQAFIVTRKSDVASDKNRYEIQLLQLPTDRPAERRAPARDIVFSADVDDDGNAAFPAIDEVRWWDDKTLVFMARLKDGLYQVYRLVLPTRELVQLTRETNRIVSFAVSRDMRRLVYSVQVPNPPFKNGARTLVVGNQSFWSVKFGQQQITAQLRKFRYFVTDVGSSQPPRPLGEAFDQGNGSMPNVDISPDGRWALLPRYEPERTLAWARQYPMLADVMKRYGPGRSRDPLAYFSGPNNFKARRMVAWQLDEGREQSILDAPDDALPNGGQDRKDRLWLDAGASVVLAGTHLPAAGNGNQSLGSHVIEYWPDADRWQIIAKLSGQMNNLLALSDGFAVIDDGKRRQFQRLANGGWREVTDAPSTAAKARPAWTLQVAEDLNQPPDVVATAANGEVVRLTTLNPQFDPNTWGIMKPYSWRDVKGQQWNGGLMASNGADLRAKLPLVIQTYGFSPSRFYLDGPNNGHGATSAFAGRAFLREGFLVLAMPLGPVGGQPFDDYRRLRRFNAGVRGAVDALVKEGRVDPARVSIIGWSQTGQNVLNLVTFSGFPIRAATIADSDENSLYSYTVTYGFMDATWKHKEETNQGVPYGAGLAKWISNDPALHTDCVKSALRIESYGQTVKNNWDLYALLRRQYKPVEMIAIPDGGHALLTPSERMVSLQGNVDWFRFWLTGGERTQPQFPGENQETLKVQYQRWAQMAELKKADDAKPACTRRADTY